MSSKRGLVLSPGLEFRDPDNQAARVARGESVCTCEACIRGTPISPQELRTYLLFWDKLDYPGHLSGLLMHNTDELFLIETGVMNRTKIQGFPQDQTKLFSEVQLATFRSLEEKEPGVWSLGTHDGQRSRTKDEHEGRAKLIMLYDCIPVPDKEVPIEDILNFKEKRADELAAFRYHLEAVYQRVISAGDGPLAFSTELSQLETAIEAQIRSAKEWRLPLRLGGLSAKVNLETDLFRVGIIGAVSYSVGLSALASTLVGAIAGVNPKIELSSSASVGGVDRVEGPFEYITSLRQDLFL